MGNEVCSLLKGCLIQILRQQLEIMKMVNRITPPEIPNTSAIYEVCRHQVLELEERCKP